MKKSALQPKILLASKIFEQYFQPGSAILAVLKLKDVTELRSNSESTTYRIIYFLLKRSKNFHRSELDRTGFFILRSSAVVGLPRRSCSYARPLQAKKLVAHARIIKKFIYFVLLMWLIFSKRVHNFS